MLLELSVPEVETHPSSLSAWLSQQGISHSLVPLLLSGSFVVVKSMRAHAQVPAQLRGTATQAESCMEASSRRRGDSSVTAFTGLSGRTALPMTMQP